MRFRAKIYKIRPARVFVACMGLKNRSKLRFLSLLKTLKNIRLLVVPTRFLMNTYPVLEFYNNLLRLGTEYRNRVVVTMVASLCSLAGLGPIDGS